MNGHWFVIASEKTINIYSEVLKRNQLKLIRTFENRYPDKLTKFPFAKDLAQYLDIQHQLKNYDDLVIAAEPGFMGILKEKMKPQTKKVVREWIHKDLLKIPLKDLSHYLPLDHPKPVTAHEQSAKF